MKPIYVAITSFKGGVGCSTLTVLLASRLHFEYARHVAIIDCDTLNHFCSSLRGSEVKGSNDYPIIETTPEKAFADTERLPENTEIVFFDLPKSGVFSLMWKMDVVYIPVEEYSISTEWLKTFCDMADEVRNKGRVMSFRAIMTKCATKSETFLWNIMKSAGVEYTVKAIITDIKIPNSKYFGLKSFNDKVCVSTVSAMDFSLIKKIKLIALERDLLQISKIYINHKNKNK